MIFDVWIPIFLLNINMFINCKSEYTKLKNRISGGNETTSSEYPFVVLIQTSYIQEGIIGHGKCTGSIVAEHAVLTVAHCVANKYRTLNIRETYSLVGANSNDDPDALRVNTHNIITITSPTDASETERRYADLAIVHTTDSLLSDGRGQIITMAHQVSSGMPRFEARIVGWGLPSFAADEYGPTKLKVGIMSAIPCGPRVEEVQRLCLSSRTTMNMRGDSGGPVINTADNLLTGVIHIRGLTNRDAREDQDFLRRAEAVGVPFYYQWITSTLNRIKFLHE